MSSNTILQEIIERKQQQVAERKQGRALSELRAELPEQSDIRPFVDSLRTKINGQQPGLIAEIKKASPSKGLIRADFDPVQLAKDYETAGATCLSVLTDEEYFQGSDDYLAMARDAVSLPVLRKDFMVDPYQITESRWLGADCILLIVGALETSQLQELAQCAREIKLDTLVEVHNEEELEIGLSLETGLIGINNRDLHSFETDLQTTYRLLPLIPAETLVITESGIQSRGDILAMQEQGVYGYLIGETFMRADKPGDKLREVVFGDD